MNTRESCSTRNTFVSKPVNLTEIPEAPRRKRTKKSPVTDLRTENYEAWLRQCSMPVIK